MPLTVYQYKANNSVLVILETRSGINVDFALYFRWWPRHTTIALEVSSDGAGPSQRLPDRCRDGVSVL